MNTNFDRNIYLVGLMGAGKTTLGRILARRLGKRFIDSDHEIERRTGVSIPTIFEIEGEEGFRKREAQVISELTLCAGLVLATGGGAVLDPQSREFLKSRGVVVYLDVPPDALFERLRNDKGRPLLQTADPLGKLRELFTQRDPLYREVAAIVLDGKRSSAQGMAERLLRTMGEACNH